MEVRIQSPRRTRSRSPRRTRRNRRRRWVHHWGWELVPQRAVWIHLRFCGWFRSISSYHYNIHNKHSLVKKDRPPLWPNNHRIANQKPRPLPSPKRRLRQLRHRHQLHPPSLLPTTSLNLGRCRRLRPCLHRIRPDRRPGALHQQHPQ